jgi:N6-L-threonylcarbamoyladenine synthase
MLHSGDFDFSFSGLKTAVSLLKARALDLPPAIGENPAQIRADIAASFQEAIVDVLVAKAMAALKAEGRNQLVVSGGVGANRRLRECLTATARRAGAEVFYPPLEFCTDNGAMIAFAAALRIEADPTLLQRPSSGFNVRPRWNLADVNIVS